MRPMPRAPWTRPRNFSRYSGNSQYVPFRGRALLFGPTSVHGGGGKDDLWGLVLMGNLTLRSFALIWVAIALGGFGQIFLKKGLAHGALGGTSITDTLTHVLQAIIQPYVLLGLLLYVISTFFWMMILSRVRLSVAYPLISMSYPLVVLLSVLILKEPVDWRFAVGGLLCISLGVSFIGLGLGRNKEVIG